MKYVTPALAASPRGRWRRLLAGELAKIVANAR
jgi:hypothetical protein